ncbi:MAG: MurR/RpiR family transcriptional regulator [Chloroflexota bacterium]
MTTVRAATDSSTAGSLGRVLDRIVVSRDSLYPAERKVAEVVLAAPDQVMLMPIAELAEQAGVSEGTVVRFAHSMGCGGYQALKLALAADVAQPTRIIHDDIEPGDADEARTIASKVFGSDIQALEATLRALDEASLEAATAAIAKAHQVVWFASGTSMPVALDAAGRFLRIGVNAYAEIDAHLQLMRASAMEKGDVAVAISHSGLSREPIECLTIARKRGARTIAITGRHPSPLTDEANIFLLTLSTETRYREEALASRIAQLSLIDTIFVSVALGHPERAITRLRETSEALETHRVAT